MTVSALIKELRKLPQHLEVAVAAHDNSEKIEKSYSISFIGYDEAGIWEDPESSIKF